MVSWNMLEVDFLRVTKPYLAAILVPKLTSEVDVPSNSLNEELSSNLLKGLWIYSGGGTSQ